MTGGGPGSNFCAAAALAARVAGLRCELVLWGDPAGAPNVELAMAVGARILPTGRYDREEVDGLAAERAAELNAAGTRAVAVPRGGSTPVGALGFLDAGLELALQLGDDHARRRSCCPSARAAAARACWPASPPPGWTRRSWGSR